MAGSVEGQKVLGFRGGKRLDFLDGSFRRRCRQPIQGNAVITVLCWCCCSVLDNGTFYNCCDKTMAHKVDLVCKEIIYDEVDSQFAEPDPTMVADDRVIQNLIGLERLTIPPCNYFSSVQQDIKPNMRKIVTTWMLEVSLIVWDIVLSERDSNPLTSVWPGMRRAKVRGADLPLGGQLLRSVSLRLPD